jgi:HAD superfamily hydrolase (TIGR01549 family)
MQIEAVFFDIGNTLCFYNYDFLRGLLAERFGLSVASAELAETHAAVQREIVAEGLPRAGQDALWHATYRRWLARAGVDEERLEPVIEAIRRHPFRHLFWARVEEGTREMLDWFRERGVKLGVISNAEGQIRRLLEHVGLDARFDVIADSAVVGIAKPEEGIFRYALEAVGVAPAHSVYVGDLYEIDVVGARKVGMLPILVDREGEKNASDCLTLARAVDLPQLPLFSPLA